MGKGRQALVTRLVHASENARRKGGRIPREWNSISWVAFQIRTPVDLKRELVAYAQATGQSQQAIVTQALEAFLRKAKEGTSGGRQPQGVR